MPQLELQNVVFQDDGQRLLGPISLLLPKTGVTAVLGANGAGKTLVLSLCHGLILPSKGRVLWGGKPTTNSIAQRGYMFQNTPVLRRSVADNIGFPLLGRKINPEQRRAMVTEALRKARLLDKALQPAAALSGGERQRMALARTAVTNPQVIFLDEPAASLDPASVRELENMVLGIVDDGVTVLLATHDIPQAKRLADWVVFLDQGLVIEQAKAYEFFKAPQSQEAQKYLDGEL